jgi:lipoprotein-anchoring transpeptidase ErfK/SrfK
VGRFVKSAAVLTAWLLACAAFASAATRAPGAHNGSARARCGPILGVQVSLDRAGFSPGVIDGLAGPNVQRTLRAFQKSRGLAPTGGADCATWKQLTQSGSSEPTTTYRITPEDAKGPFSEGIPEDLMEQARLPALSYQSLVERLAEKFHCSPALLQRLNPTRELSVDHEITVPNVEPFAIERPPREAESSDVTIEVSKQEGLLRVRRPDGSLALVAPVSSGSRHDPLPLGRWRITNVAWQPLFHYSPDLFWDADPSHARATIKAGPNGPVGVAWLGIDVAHYGIHGSAEPSHVGHTQSHGCVRLTNWDVARLMALVRVGTPVVFR